MCECVYVNINMLTHAHKHTSHGGSLQQRWQRRRRRRLWQRKKGSRPQRGIRSFARRLAGLPHACARVHVNIDKVIRSYAYARIEKVRAACNNNNNSNNGGSRSRALLYAHAQHRPTFCANARVRLRSRSDLMMFARPFHVDLLPPARSVVGHAEFTQPIFCNLNSVSTREFGSLIHIMCARTRPHIIAGPLLPPASSGWQNSLGFLTVHCAMALCWAARLQMATEPAEPPR